MLEINNLGLKMILKWTILCLCLNAVFSKPQGTSSAANCDTLKDNGYS